MNLTISPDPVTCANVSGGVNSVVSDHAAGFLNAGHSINRGDGLKIAHAVAQLEDLDIFHCHGLYPIGPNHFDNSYSRLNQMVLQNALKAKLTICISEFSANILRHKLHIDPYVIRNGIYIENYPAAGSASGPIIFPKATLDANAKAEDVLWLRQHSTLNLLSIAPIPGVKSLGNLKRGEFLSHLQRCSIYLGTTKENNSMAAMEAMRSGVPYVGYDYGFAKEWLISGTGCKLVAPGDKQALLDAIRLVQSNWKQYSKAAREYAEIFDWKPVIDELLGIYSKIGKEPMAQKVSIVIPCHNYGQWVGEAVESALAQTVESEIIIIDDCSTDNSWDVISRFGNRIKAIRNETNLGVAESRNKAIEQASGQYIVCLDADDRLLPDFVKRHLEAFTGRDQAIAYAPIELVDVNGKAGNGKMFHNHAMPSIQKTGRNQIPSCCMFRKVFWERAGGYEKRYSPAEDAHLWLKMFALGGTSKRAANEPLMEYRMHSNSLSSKGFPNWHDTVPFWITDPILERDPETTFVLDSLEGANETLWSIESQKNPRWAVHLPKRSQLHKTFPWLNKGIGTADHRSVIHIKTGTCLPPNFLNDFEAQPPAWMETPRSPLLSQPSSAMRRT